MEVDLIKHLFLIRHAKSSWKDELLSDFDRPLNKRGKKEAPFIAKILKQRGVFFDLLLCSPSNRTKSTAKFFDELKISHESKFDERIYEAHYQTLVEIISSVDESVKNLAIIGHNPSLNELCEYLCNCVIDNMPTSSCVMLSFDGQWKDITENSARIEFFEYPKKHIF